MTGATSPWAVCLIASSVPIRLLATCVAALTYRPSGTVCLCVSVCLEGTLLSVSVKTSPERKSCFKPPTKTEWTCQTQRRPVSCLCQLSTILFSATAHLTLKMSLSALYNTAFSCLYSRYKTHTQTGDAEQFTLCNSKKRALRLWRREYLFNSWICQLRFRVHVRVWNLCARANIHHTPRRKLLEHLSLGWTDLACWFVSETHLAGWLCNLCRTSLKNPQIWRDWDKTNEILHIFKLTEERHVGSGSLAPPGIAQSFH